jgi:LysR family transcriptional regulator, nitrogen assimilation regulatory protein
MELRRLSYLVSACQERSFGAAAARLGIRQSTLSGAMKTLAEEFGVPLFEQMQRRVHPTLAGIWLYRSALLLLHAEEFARNWIGRGPDDGSTAHLIVDIRASFVLGQLGKSVGRAIQRFTRDHPNIFVQPCFSGVGQVPGQARSIAGPIGAQRSSIMVVEARPAQAASAPRDGIGDITLLGRDYWVTLQAARCRQSGKPRPSTSSSYLVPHLDQPLIDQLMAAVGVESGLVECRDEPASMLPRLIAQHPTETFLIPRSLAADRLDQDHVDIRSFQLVPDCELVARFNREDAAARRLSELIREELAARDGTLSFDPVLSHREMRYAGALVEFGSITAAARSLAIAQPALTEALQKLEETLDCRFFHRSREGLAMTPAGNRLDSASQVLMEGVRRINVQSASVAGGDGGRLKIGVGPFELHNGLTARCIARAIGAWRHSFPSIRLQVVQGSTHALQEMVASGTVGFAITERTAPGIVRINLAGQEPLSLIANPRFGLLPAGPVRLADLARQALILPAPTYAVRQILDAAALDAHIKLSPQMEINAIAILLAVLREQPCCSVLPASSVQEQLEEGTLESHLIVEPTVVRQFYVSHSGHRELSDAEREFLKALRLEFRRASSQIALKPVLPALRQSDENRPLTFASKVQ